MCGNASRYVSAPMDEKAASGLANRVPPLGYKSEKLSSGKRKRKVPDLETLPILRALLEELPREHFPTGKWRTDSTPGDSALVADRALWASTTDHRQSTGKSSDTGSAPLGPSSHRQWV